MSVADNKSGNTRAPSGGEKGVQGSSLVNDLQVKAWRVLEYLVGRQFDLASVTEISGAFSMPVNQVRRILFTWEFLGLVERRGDMFRLTSYLMHEIPQRLKLALAERFRDLEKSSQ